MIEQTNQLPYNELALEYVFKEYMKFMKSHTKLQIKHSWNILNKFQSKHNPYNKLPCNILGDFVVCMN